MKPEFYDNIEKLADKVANSQSLDDVRTMSREGELSSLFEGKYSDCAQTCFLSDLIKKGAKDEFIEFFLDQNLKTYFNKATIDEVGVRSTLLVNALETAEDYKRDNLVKQIADIQVCTVFKNFKENYDGIGFKESHKEALIKAYGCCDEKYQIKLDDLLRGMMSRKESPTEISELLVKCAKSKLLSQKAIDDTITYCLDNFSSADTLGNVAQTCSTIEQIQRTLDMSKKNLPNIAISSVISGLNRNENTEVLIYAYQNFPEMIKNNERIIISTMEVATALYDKGLISIEKLGETCIYNGEVTKFNELLEKGLDTKKVEIATARPAVTVRRNIKKHLDKFIPTFIEHGMSNATRDLLWRYNPEKMFTLLKEKNPKQFLKDVIVRPTLSEHIQELIEQKQAKLDTKDIYDIAKLVSDRPSDTLDKIKATLSKLGYAEAYKKAEAEIKKAAEEARISGIVKEIPFMTKKKQSETLERYGDNKEVVKALFASGMDISADKLKAMFTAEELAEVRMSEKVKAGLAENEKKSAELAEAQKAFEQKEQQINAKLAETKARLDQQERDVTTRETAVKSERATSINAAEDINSLSDAEKKTNFDAKKKLMEEHPIMVEPCLNSMCESYVATKDEAIKKEMLNELYEIRKSGDTNSEKREMARTFKRVLDKNPALTKDENLVALSKIDYAFSQPTKAVKKQIDSRN